jgi:hypothetical protein
LWPPASRHPAVLAADEVWRIPKKGKTNPKKAKKTFFGMGKRLLRIPKKVANPRRRPFAREHQANPRAILRGAPCLPGPP